MKQITKDIIEKAPKLFEERKKGILKNLQDMELALYTEYERLRKINVPLKERLHTVDTAKQTKITNEKNRISKLTFVNTFLFEDLMITCRTEEEVKSYYNNLEKIIYYNFETFGYEII